MARKGFTLYFLVFTLVAFVGILILLQRQQREVQARTAFYTDILAQAPCIENVCPGFTEGRARTLEHLSESSMIKRASAQGSAIVSFAFSGGGSETGGGSGGVYFTTDSSGNPEVVQRISFRLHNLRLVTVLNTLGEPDQFLFISGCGMGLQVHAKLFYLSRGIEVVINYVTRQPASQVLTNDTPVSSIEYFIPDDFQNHIQDSLDRYILNSVAYDLHSYKTAEDFIGQIAPWPGTDASPTPSADFCPR